MLHKHDNDTQLYIPEASPHFSWHKLSVEPQAKQHTVLVCHFEHILEVFRVGWVTHSHVSHEDLVLVACLHYTVAGRVQHMWNIPYDATTNISIPQWLFGCAGVPSTHHNAAGAIAALALSPKQSLLYSTCRTQQATPFNENSMGMTTAGETPWSRSLLGLACRWQRAYSVTSLLLLYNSCGTTIRGTIPSIPHNFCSTAGERSDSVYNAQISCKWLKIVAEALQWRHNRVQGGSIATLLLPCSFSPNQPVCFRMPRRCEQAVLGERAGSRQDYLHPLSVW